MHTEDIPYGYCHCGCGEKTRISEHNHAKWGHVKGEPRKFLYGHYGKLSTRTFESYFTEGGPDDCWEWQGFIGRDGYGRYNVRSGLVVGAHRHAYEQAHGEIPRGLLICHSCDNRKCVNPAHLWPGTHADNSRDMARKGRSRAPQGVRMTMEKACRVRALRAEGWTYRRLAEEFGVSMGTINHIVHHRIWKEEVAA